MMYFVTLVLQGQDADYANLFNVIQALGPWSNRMGNRCWMVESRYSAKAIRDLLKPQIKQGDRVFVAQFVQNWAGTNMGDGFKEWMDRRTFDVPVVPPVIKPID